ncbi:MAG TPA: IPT/TIG domain-containing protein [Thermoanaerobaculia bacterium]|nr:IPT/TIG domain-containing protein [Thermoanaerobaculia bacterium]
MNGWLFVALLWATSALAPAPAPQLAPQEVRTFTITARRFTYNVSPLPFSVNQGDLVTLNISANDDGDGIGHGFRLRTYADSSHALIPGSPITIQFTAHTAGQFQFFCTRFCGSGHSGMDGVFTVIGPQPLAVAGVAPSTGPTSGGTTVTIQGTGFAAGATVKFGTIPAASVEAVSSTELRAVTPAGPFDFATTRMVDVIVTNPDGATGQKLLSYTWTVPAPSVASVVPASGPRAGGTLVTIRGGGFSTAVPASVTIGGAAATAVTVVDAVTLTARTPAHATGPADVAISTSKGSTTSAGAFRYVGSRQRAVRH